MPFTNSSSSSTGRKDMSMPWRRDSLSPARDTVSNQASSRGHTNNNVHGTRQGSSLPSRVSDNVTESSPYLTTEDMHLGDFYYLPVQEKIPEAFWPKHWYRNKGMFNHPVVIVDINTTTGYVSYRSVTSARERTDRIKQGINGQDRMATRVRIQRRGDVIHNDKYHNEHQLGDQFYLHDDSAVFKNTSEILIAEGLIFEIQRHVLQPLGWAKGNRVRLDTESTDRLVWRCPKVQGPASSPRRGSSSSDSSSSSRSSSGSPSPPLRQRGILTRRSANIMAPSTKTKSELMKEKW